MSTFVITTFIDQCTGSNKFGNKSSYDEFAITAIFIIHECLPLILYHDEHKKGAREYKQKSTRDTWP